ncbi:hypothetical protein [Thermosporothrix hazakensis]|uniref:hypothetical protein n=1 Tax=Thermosporothrix hazakensis TaxID=644383 RepID=UPI000DACD8FE|nr:hypothetical protein KTH_53360 [Thermosporothrix hazakensis]
MTPIALVGYRNYVQRIQRRTTGTVNGQHSALRAFCAWLTEACYPEVNPAKRLKLVGRQDTLSRKGPNDAQAIALLDQARTPCESLCNYATVQVLLQTGMRLDECNPFTLDDLKLGERQHPGGDPPGQREQGSHDSAQCLSTSDFSRVSGSSVEL